MDEGRREQWKPEPLRVPIHAPEEGEPRERRERSGERETPDRDGSHVVVIDIS